MRIETDSELNMLTKMITDKEMEGIDVRVDTGSIGSSEISAFMNRYMTEDKVYGNVVNIEDLFRQYVEDTCENLLDVKLSAGSSMVSRLPIKISRRWISPAAVMKEVRESILEAGYTPESLKVNTHHDMENVAGMLVGEADNSGGIRGIDLITHKLIETVFGFKSRLLERAGRHNGMITCVLMLEESIREFADRNAYEYMGFVEITERQCGISGYGCYTMKYKVYAGRDTELNGTNIYLSFTGTVAKADVSAEAAENITEAGICERYYVKADGSEFVGLEEFCMLLSNRAVKKRRGICA